MDISFRYRTNRVEVANTTEFLCISVTHSQSKFLKICLAGALVVNGPTS